MAGGYFVVVWSSCCRYLNFPLSWSRRYYVHICLLAQHSSTVSHHTTIGSPAVDITDPSMNVSGFFLACSSTSSSSQKLSNPSSLADYQVYQRQIHKFISVQHGPSPQPNLFADRDKWTRPFTNFSSSKHRPPPPERQTDRWLLLDSYRSRMNGLWMFSNILYVVSSFSFSVGV